MVTGVLVVLAVYRRLPDQPQSSPRSSARARTGRPWDRLRPGGRRVGRLPSADVRPLDADILPDIRLILPVRSDRRSAVIQLLFLLIAALGLLAALGTVLARNLVHAALFLVAFFFIDRLPVRPAGGRVPGGDPGARLHRRGGDPPDVRDHADPEHPGRRDDHGHWAGRSRPLRRRASASSASWSSASTTPVAPAGRAPGRRSRHPAVDRPRTPSTTRTRPSSRGGQQHGRGRSATR